MRGLNRGGHTIVVVTHDPEVARHAGRVISLADGEIVGEERAEVPGESDGGFADGPIDGEDRSDPYEYVPAKLSRVGPVDT